MALPLLDGLSAELALWLARRVVVRRLGRGTLVAEQGQPDQALFILLSGAAHSLRQSASGRNLVLDTLGRGDHFGEPWLADGLLRASSVRCAGPSEVLMIHRADFAHCLAQSPALQDRLLHTMVERLRNSNRRCATTAQPVGAGASIAQQRGAKHVSHA